MGFITVNDVKTVARELWPNATNFNVHLVSDTMPRLYKITALDSNAKLIGRMSAKSLAELKADIEVTINRRKSPESQ